ncbi:RHS repeat-associated core domain-containing protein [Porticoccus sp. GXU_MW_L64]
MYDPKIARFLQADPFIQDPMMTQSLNRYSYVWNNPLNATDPSGYFVGQLLSSYILKKTIQSSWIGKNVIQPALQYISSKPILNAVVTIVIAYYGGASAVAAYSEAVTYANGGSLLDGVKAGAISFAQSYVFSQIGGADLSAPERIFAHAVAGGVFSELQGGKFGHGFVSAGLTKAFTSYIGFDYSDGSTAAVIGRTTVAAIVGGTISELTGGKFGNGAATAAIAHLFNAELSAAEHRKRFAKGTSGKGHHWVPGGSLNDLDVSDDARSVFGQSVSGEKLPREVHQWDKTHKKYNLAVRQELAAFAAENDIDLSRMTKSEAKAFVNRVRTSNNPNIRILVRRIDRFNSFSAAQKRRFWFASKMGLAGAAEAFYPSPMRIPQCLLDPSSPGCQHM